MDSPSSLKSTTQFYGHMGGAARLVRAIFSVAQALGPWCAVPLARQVFLTPLPLKWLQKPLKWDAPWRIATQDFERASVTLYQFEGAQPNAATVLLVHGWGGSAWQMLPIAKALAQSGFAPIVLELPAHGKNRGATTALPQFARAVEYCMLRLEEAGRAPIALVGHSAGAAACALAARRSPHAPKLVMIAAPENMQHYTIWFAQLFGLREATRAAMQRRIEAEQGALMSQFSFEALSRGLKNKTLVVHDTNDPLHPSTSARDFAQRIERGEFLETSGLGHTKILRDAAVGARIAKFFGDID